MEAPPRSAASIEVPIAPPAKSRPTSRPPTPRTASQVEAAIINAVNPTPGTESFADQLRKQMMKRVPTAATGEDFPGPTQMWAAPETEPISSQMIAPAQP
eukprot:4021638-Pyramimonas_sp.AAC.1